MSQYRSDQPSTNYNANKLHKQTPKFTSNGVGNRAPATKNDK